jgi:HPt (histidine-containing phosphotransfer) domain-containing protein
MTAAYDLKQKMQVLWQKYLPEMNARLATVHSAIEALSHGSLSHDLRNAAAHEAHKLAGSLGTFGAHEGTVAAREIERLLSEQVMPANMSGELERNFAHLRQAIERR